VTYPQDAVVPELPDNAPRAHHAAWLRALARGVLRLGGWRMVGRWPDVRKVVVIVAPHSSGWDGIWGLAAKIALDVHIVFIGKTELFRGPPKPAPAAAEVGDEPSRSPPPPAFSSRAGALRGGGTTPAPSGRALGRETHRVGHRGRGRWLT